MRSTTDSGGASSSDAPITDEAFEAGLPLHFRRGLSELGQPVAARWAYREEIAGENWRWQPGSWFLGYRNGAAIGRADDRHLLLAAGSRGGKGVSVIIPNCLLWEGSLLAIDPKGELAQKTAGYRQRGPAGQPSGDVVILDPFGISGHARTHGYNPLMDLPELDPAATDRGARKQLAAIVDAVALIADGLIIHTGSDAHWSDGARQLLKGVILYVLTLPPDERNLLTVRQLLMLRYWRLTQKLTGDTANLDQRLFRRLAACEAFDGIVQGVGASMGNKPEREAASILSVAQVQTDFLDSPSLADVLQGSDFSLRDLKRKRVSVYLCLPASHMGTYARWLRLVINLALAALEAEPTRDGAPPVLVVLEEFNVLGHMASIATAAGQIAGFGVRLLTVLQDLTQLQAHYQAAWETFIGNAGLFLAFANSDATTLKYISEKLGTVSVAVENRNPPGLQASLAGAQGVNYSMQSMPLLAPHEVEAAFAREHQRLLVMVAGGKRFMVRRTISHRDPRFIPLLNLSL